MIKTHGSLFSGIGGFDLAAEWLGWENLFHCEYNPFGQKILKHYWPNAHSFHDITTTDFTGFYGLIDILTGGFPCQPYSTAGKRLGKEDERHLWPHMLRAVREIRPVWVVGENVRGLISWNDGMVFDQVQIDLENEGYEVFPFLLPACGVNAPHRRERIWFVAYSNSNGLKRASEFSKNDNSGFQERMDKRYEFNSLSDGGAATDAARERCGEEGPNNGGPAKRYTGVSDERVTADTLCKGLPVATCREQRSLSGEIKTPQGRKFSRAYATDAQWSDFPTQSPVRSGNDGFPFGLDGITLSKWRTESIKAAGNAIVPQVAYVIFQAIDTMEILY